MPKSETPPSSLRQPTQAGPARRAWHLLVALAGWVLFVYWWLLVLGGVSAWQVRITALFLLVTAAVCIIVTALWSLHNLRIHRHRGARMRVRIPREDYSNDRLGRGVTFTGQRAAAQEGPVVEIRIEQDRKVYLAASPHPGGTRPRVAAEPRDDRP